MFRQAEGTGGPGEHDRLRDIVNAFRVNVREDGKINLVRTGTWWIKVLD